MRHKPVTCHNCGQTWPRHPALEVKCPDCRAPVGQNCRRPSGHNCDIHARREALAVDTGVLPMCPKGPTALGLKKPEPAAAAAAPGLFD